MTHALFYPWIDIQDEAWLKNSLLYWDSVQTIVPTAINTPYSTNTGRSLYDAGFLRPLLVHHDMPEINELTGDVLGYLTTTEGLEVLSGQDGGRRHNIHLGKLPGPFRELAHMHPEKLPHGVLRLIHQIAEPSEQGGDWLRVDGGFANFYMTLLANRLAERTGSRLVTSLPAADALAQKARLGAQLNGLIPWDDDWNPRHWREFSAFGPRRLMRHTLAPGMLATLAIERMGVAPDTPIDRLIEFRKQHGDELAVFRSKIENIASTVKEDLPVEAMRQRIADLNANEVAPAIENLKKALQGRKIAWMTDGLLKVAFLSVGSLAVLTVAGLSAPTALLVGAGISLIATATRYNVEKQDSLRGNPFSYLLSVKRELA